jgi:TatD family-associated radical SAM protein
VVIDALEKADYKKYKEIVYCGYGEPTERIEVLTETAKFIKENNGPAIRVNTNGLSDLIHKKPTAYMFEDVVDTVSVSLNAGTKEEYLKVTRPSFGEESYEAMQKFAAECKKYVKNVVFSVVDVIGEEQLKASQEMADKLGIKLRIRKYES